MEKHHSGVRFALPRSLSLVPFLSFLCDLLWISKFTRKTQIFRLLHLPQDWDFSPLPQHCQSLWKLKYCSSGHSLMCITVLSFIAPALKVMPVQTYKSKYCQAQATCLRIVELNDVTRLTDE